MKNNPAAVLIVEDEIMLQDVYKLVLESNGYKVSTANNGQEALDIINKILPDVVLLDMLMPVMGGQKFMQTIDRKEFPNTRIIVYTNLSDSAIEAEMLELGADRFILKSSMTPTDLIDLVENI
jgi:CheY-like chemotaxis protein